MCVIIIKPEGKTIPAELLRSAWNQNPHGMGFAVWNGDKWEVQKGFMKLKDALKAIEPHNREDTRLIAHFRFATHGGRIPELTHPFPIEFAEGRGWLFHNGVFDINMTGEDESDTSVFAKAVSLMRPVFKGFCEFLKTEVATNTTNASRLAVILEHSPQVFAVGSWHEEDGIYLSSYLYQYSLVWEDEDEPELSHNHRAYPRTSRRKRRKGRRVK